MGSASGCDVPEAAQGELMSERFAFCRGCPGLPEGAAHGQSPGGAAAASAPRLGPVLPALHGLVQQPPDGTAALRRQKAQEECGQGRPPGAAGEDPGPGGAAR